MENKLNFTFENTEVAFSSKSNKDLRKAHFLFTTISKPWMVRLGTGLTKFGLSARLPIKGLIKNTIYAQFCGGETIEESQPTINELANFGIGTILDYSVEGAEDETSFEYTTQEIIKTIHKSKGNKDIPFCVFKPTGLAKTKLLEKIQTGAALSEKEKIEWQAVKERVNRICSEAYAHDVRLFLDAEESWIQDPIDQLAYEMMAMYNKEQVIIYNTFQMYRHDMLKNMKQAHQQAMADGYQLGVKMVRGAYMEKERERAQEFGYPSPIQPDKASTDRDFNAALLYCIENIDTISLCSGSHNEDSNYYLAELMAKHKLPANDERIYFAQLYGMSDNISFNLALAGYNVAKYVPYGPVKSVMPYLFRRAEENTSIAGQTSREFTLVKKELTRRKTQK